MEHSESVKAARSRLFGPNMATVSKAIWLQTENGITILYPSVSLTIYGHSKHRSQLHNKLTPANVSNICMYDGACTTCSALMWASTLESAPLCSLHG